MRRASPSPATLSVTGPTQVPSRTSWGTWSPPPPPPPHPSSATASTSTAITQYPHRERPCIACAPYQGMPDKTRLSPPGGAGGRAYDSMPAIVMHVERVLITLWPHRRGGNDRRIGNLRLE